MKDGDLVSLLRRIGYEEGLPAVTDPGILDPREFLDTVLTVRFPNPFLPDSPQRIATDTSQKLSVRFGETIKAYMTSPDLDMDRLRGIPLVLAGWLRYRMAVDDDGRLMELSPDPMAESWDGSWNGYSWEAVFRWSTFRIGACSPAGRCAGTRDQGSPPAGPVGCGDLWSGSF